MILPSWVSLDHSRCSSFRQQLSPQVADQWLSSKLLPLGYTVSCWGVWPWIKKLLRILMMYGLLFLEQRRCTAADWSQLGSFKIILVPRLYPRYWDFSAWVPGWVFFKTPPAIPGVKPTWRTTALAPSFHCPVLFWAWPHSPKITMEVPGQPLSNTQAANVPCLSFTAW